MILIHRAVLSVVTIIIIMLSAVKSKDLSNDDEETDEIETDTKNTDADDELSPVMRFTYGDNDPLGPLHWRNKLLVDKLIKHEATMNPSEMKHNQSYNSTTLIPPNLERFYAHNFCQTNWLSPINIETNRVNVPDLRRLKDSLPDELQKVGIPETLTIHIAQSKIQNKRFEFGHPSQYHGIEIQPPSVGLIQLTDNFDPLPQTTSSTAYDFHFLSLFYCDIKKASPYRTMHQIDGKRYPLELEYIFLRKAPPQSKFSAEGLMDEDSDFANDSPADSISTLYESEYLAVIVSVLGEIGPEDNVYFNPVVEAAQKFHGKDNDGIDQLVRSTRTIQAPWSPTWLLPGFSDYYYYDDASFPVPPCWSVQRYYIMRETIKISQNQLESLTHIQTKRERSTGNFMKCTHSIAIVNPEEKSGKGATLFSGETSVKLNLIGYAMTGEVADGKPRSKEEKMKMEERKKQIDIFRKRWSGERLDEMSDAVGLKGDKREIRNSILRISTFVLLSRVKSIFVH